MPIKMVVGLGNPGQKYDGTRHNIGRRVVESLQGAPLEQKIVWLITEKFMNESGIEVKAAAKYYKIAPEEILVVLDEFQIPLRKISILKQGSDGGHNGLKSVIDHLGTKDVPRMRIGIGPLPEQQDPADFVLKKFSNSEKQQMDQFFHELGNAVTTAIIHGIDTAMNKYNGRQLA